MASQSENAEISVRENDHDTNSPGSSQPTNNPPSSCVFCKISSGLDEKTELLYQDEEYVVFKDIKAAATHHYLVVPKKHIKDGKSLTNEHIPLIHRMKDIGLQVLQDRQGDQYDVRLGFHWPPFTTISHLHLHVISPVKEMSFLSRIIFRPGTWWFISFDELLELLKTKTSN